LDNGGSEGTQTANLTINGGRIGTTVGTASYPNIGCTYDFRLVSSQINEVTIYEEIRTGPCISAYVVLVSVGNKLEEDVYDGTPSSQDQPYFTGQLWQVKSFA
jgi:hypothetical protein